MSRKRIFDKSAFIYLELDQKMKDDLVMYVENYKVKTGECKSVNEIIRELISNKVYEQHS